MDNQQYKPTALNEYFAWLEANIDPNSALYQAAHTYMEGERLSAKEEEPDRPFLTVVIRTQGKRSEMFREALLCMTAQSNTDFELLIMGHNLSEEQNISVTALLGELPAWMRAQTRLIPVNGGTRTTPLNRGFEEARGKYVAVFDDDDLVYDHWVDAFYRLSLEHDGKMLHQYCAKQNWKTVSDTPCAVGEIDDFFCRDFHLLWQTIFNSCPLCSMAFPIDAFRRWGIRFNETLNTTEDWDFMMRCAFLTGVANGTELTSLYRIWVNAENSQTVHSKNEWDQNYRNIVEGFVNTPIVMPSGALHGIADVRLTPNGVIDGADLLQRDTLSAHTEIAPALYYSDGAEYHDLKKWLPCEGFDQSTGQYVFSAPQNCPKKLFAIRFVPRACGGFMMHDLQVSAEDVKGNVIRFPLDRITTNGYPVKDSLCFLKDAPRVEVQFQQPINVRKIVISCRIEPSVPNDVADQLVKLRYSGRWKRSLPYRAVRKLKRMIKK